jgi:hypothetical protein
MPENRTARNEAWIASAVVHALVLAGLIAIVGRPRQITDLPVIIGPRDSGHEVGVVTLADPSARPAAKTSPVKPPAIFVPPPPVATPPVAHAPGSPVPPTVRAVEHREPAVTGFMPQITPASYAAGSPRTTSQPTEPTLPPGAVTVFFGVPAVGKSVVFVLDRSASMGLDGRLDRARRELAASLRRLPPTARFQVIAYNRTAEAILGGPQLLSAASDTIESVISMINSLPAEGTSEHAKALTKALSLQPDVIYFLTDEDDLEMRDVLAVTRINHGRACIHALCVVPPAGSETPMQRLARENRGQFKIIE